MTVDAAIPRGRVNNSRDWRQTRCRSQMYIAAGEETNIDPTKKTSVMHAVIS